MLPGRSERTDFPSTLFPATVTVESTTEVVLSATSTVTVTTSQIEYALYKRSHVRKDKIQGRAAAAAPVVTPRAELSKRMLMKARQAASSATRTLDVSSLGDALSSACSCKMIPPLTTFLTSSASAVVSLQIALDQVWWLTRTDADNWSHRLSHGDCQQHPCWWRDNHYRDPECDFHNQTHRDWKRVLWDGAYAKQKLHNKRHRYWHWHWHWHWPNLHTFIEQHSHMATYTQSWNGIQPWHWHQWLALPNQEFDFPPLLYRLHKQYCNRHCPFDGDSAQHYDGSPILRLL